MQSCAWYGAAAVALLEFTNWFFLPYILMKQSGYSGAPFIVLGSLFVVVYFVCRIVLGTWLGIAFAVDVAALASSDAGLWVAVVTSLLTYWLLMGLSVYWWFTEVMPNLHNVRARPPRRRCWARATGSAAVPAAA